MGSAIAVRLAGFGCGILGVDPGAPIVPGIESTSLNSALTRADYIILAAPLTETNRHMIGTSALALIKPGVLLINVGRGSVVDEAAVAEALIAGHLGGYAADVFELEDFALADRPRKIDPRLLAHPRTLFTPHLGSAVDRVRRQIELRAVDNIADALKGETPRDAINAPPPLLRYGS